MTQEDKQLLLQDLCARLPYGVKGIITYDTSTTTFTVEGIDNNVLHLSDAEECYAEDFKLYLRPMSSMTKEEKKIQKDYIYHFSGNSLPDYEGDFVFEDEVHEYIDWLLSKHFDYRNLIEKGLALDAPEGMYETK